MKQRTKQRLQFFLSLAILVTLTIIVGVFFGYVTWLAWQIKTGVKQIRTEIFSAMAATLFIMCISDIYLFFHLVMKRKY